MASQRLLFFGFLLYVRFVESGKDVVSDIESLVSGYDRSGENVTLGGDNHCILPFSVELIDESLDCIGYLIHHHCLLLVDLLLLLVGVILKFLLLLRELLALNLGYAAGEKTLVDLVLERLEIPVKFASPAVDFLIDAFDLCLDN